MQPDVGSGCKKGRINPPTAMNIHGASIYSCCLTTRTTGTAISLRVKSKIDTG